jgi:hypothetical protein
MHFTKFKFTFPGQQDNEEILLVIREHWVVLLQRLLAWLVFVIIFFLMNWAIDQFLPSLKQDQNLYYFDLFKDVYFMFLALGLLMVWVIYYLNVQIITNERIVDITQNSLIHHTISELHLSRIEDVTSEVIGLFGTFLNYGNVYVQTAGETERFTFSRVPNPAKIEKMVLDLYEQLPKENKHDSALEK